MKHVNKSSLAKFFKVGGISVAAVAVVIGIIWAVLYFTPVATVKEIRVTGVAQMEEQQIRDAAEVPVDTQLIRVDTQQTARNVAALPWVHMVTVDRAWPNALEIEVTEYRPAIYVRASDGLHFISDTGTEYATEPFEYPIAPGVLELTGAPQTYFPEPGKVDIEPNILEPVLEIWNALAPEVRDQAVAIQAPGPYEIEIRLHDGREVYFGSSDRAEEKARATELVLQREGHRWNVSNPAQPSVRY